MTEEELGLADQRFEKIFEMVIFRWTAVKR